MNGFLIKSVETGDFRTDYMVFGNGDEPLLIIPGISPKSVLSFADGVAEAYSGFGEKYRVYLFDRRYPMPEGYTIRMMADDTAAAMKALGIWDACVLGTSQGGMIAMVLAAKYPHLVKKLVGASTGAKANPDSDKVFREWVELCRRGDAAKVAESLAEKVYTEEMLKALGEGAVSAYSDATAEDLERFRITAEACIGYDITAEASSVKCPMLITGADDDGVLMGIAAREIAELADCELFMYESGGHAVYDTDPHFKERLLEFFGR